MQEKIPASKEAKWYVIQLISGAERSVIDAIKRNAASDNTSEYFVEFRIPASEESLSQIKSMNKIKSLLPGYILVKMVINDRSWQTVRRTDRVGRFLGGTKPLPLSEKEYNKIIKNIENTSDSTALLRKFKVDSEVVIKEGSFQSFHGTVKSINEQDNTLRISVMIFGREAEINLSPDQVDLVKGNS